MLFVRSWRMINFGQNAFWPYMHRETLKKAAKCKQCTEIVKNYKPIIPASKWKPHVNCSEPIEEIQTDFDERITYKKTTINFPLPVPIVFKIPNRRSIDTFVILIVSEF